MRRFDPKVAWYAGDSPEKTVSIPPLPWSPPSTWSTSLACVGITSYGQVDAFAHAALVEMALVDRHLSGPLVKVGPLVHLTRRNVAREFLADERLGEWLLMVDGDIVTEPLAARMLVSAGEASGLDVVGAAYPCDFCHEAGIATFDDAGQLVTADAAESKFGTLTEVHFVGFGCVVIRRTILAAVSAAYAGNGFCPVADLPALGEDWVFCLRARDVGGRVGVLNLPRIRHRKVVALGLRSQAEVPPLDGPAFAPGQREGSHDL